MRSTETIDGAPQDTFTLYHTGAPDFEIEGSPSWEAGERYLLFTREVPGGLHNTIGPDGRMREGADGRLRPTIDDENGAAWELKGKTIAQVKDAIKKARNG